MKVQERHIIGKLFGKKDPKARRERMDAEMSKPKAPVPNTKTYSQDDLEFTAKKHNMTVEQVKQKLGMK